MHINELIKQVERKLKTHIETIRNPDHPFLFLGPDILASNADTLIGIFILHVMEIKYPHDLLIRMALARLGYPGNFRAILILSPECSLESREFIQAMERQFDAVFKWREQNRIIAEIRTGLDPIHKNQGLDESRNTAYTTAGVLYAASLEDAKKSSRLRPVSDLDSWINAAPLESTQSNTWTLNLPIARDVTKKSTLREYRRFHVAATGLIRSTIVHPRLVRFGRKFFEADNKVDMGVAYRQRPPLNVLFVDHTPKHRGDPDKWLRASAFAGFAILRPFSNAHVDEKLRQLEDQLG